MTKEMHTVLMVVAGLSALMGTANAAVFQTRLFNTVSGVATGLLNATVAGLRAEILPLGLFMADENGVLVELTNDPHNGVMRLTDAAAARLVFFHLYTKENPTTSQSIVPGDTVGLHNTNWDASKPTRIVTHGWISSYTKKACTLTRDAYLEHGDYNVIVVDWSGIAMFSYGYAKANVDNVGRYVAQLIDFLQKDGMDVSQLVISGHSLGGHVAGLSARFARDTVGYVVALDPAGPLFGTVGPGERVDKTDAANVQVIHTNGGELGLEKNVGHVDFYPNGGRTQPGCMTPICCHHRVYEYFADSINSRVGFYGKYCESPNEVNEDVCQGEAVRMGGNPPIPIPTAGSYYLKTASSKPFALRP